MFDFLGSKPKPRKPPIDKFPYVGMLMLRPKSLITDHLDRMFGPDGDGHLIYGCITCNAVIAGPRFKGEPIILGEGSLWAMGCSQQVGSFPGARALQINAFAGFQDRKAIYYVQYSDHIPEFIVVEEFIRKAYSRPKDLPKLNIMRA